MGQSKNTVSNLTKFSLLFFFLYISYSFICKTFGSSFRSPYSTTDLATTSNTSKHIEDELEHALASTSMANKTLIIAMISKAYVQANANAPTSKTMIDLFLDSFLLGGNQTRRLLNHLLFVTVDQTSYDRCRFHQLHCYRLKSFEEEYSGNEKMYMSKEFVEMMWRRTLFLLDVLRRGYNFIFTDTDVMWLSDPFQRLSMDSSEDFQISTDEFNGDERSDKNAINTGFYYIKSNNKTIALFEIWYGMKVKSKGRKEQDILIYLIRNGSLKQLDLNVRYLDTLYFSGFCQRSKDIRKVVTVHANCCKGIKAKITDLTAVHHDWKKFKQFGIENQIILGATVNQTAARGFSNWTKPIACNNSWKN